MGEPLHSLCLCGEMHEIEEEMYRHYLFKPSESIEPQPEESKE